MAARGQNQPGLVTGRKRASRLISDLMIQILNTPQLESATKALCAVEPRFESIVARHGIPSLRKSPQGLEGLLIIITEQFLSLQAAASIWARLKIRLEPYEPACVLACPEAELVSLGLSRTKARAFHAAAKCDLNFTDLSEDVIFDKLCAVHGVGPWTADIYLLSVMGLADAWPKGDLALRIAMQDFLKLPKRPEIAEMPALAESWRPHRAVAARLLWSHYRGLRGLEQA
jgi:DNA-3-methyladenine glycosylase II